MPDWGKANTAADAPKFLTGMKAAGYGNTFNTHVVSHSAAGASGKGYLHQGWVYRKVGTGGVESVAVTAGGTGYTNGAAVTFTGGGGSGAAGTIVVSGGAITGVTITNPGSGYTSAPTVTVPTGTGATFSVKMGGRAGRIQYETLVAQASQTP